MATAVYYETDKAYPSSAVSSASVNAYQTIAKKLSKTADTANDGEVSGTPF